MPDPRPRIPGRNAEATPEYLLRKLLRKAADILQYLYLMPVV
jgi:hypothetical protein